MPATDGQQKQKTQQALTVPFGWAKNDRDPRARTPPAPGAWRVPDGIPSPVPLGRKTLLAGSMNALVAVQELAPERPSAPRRALDNSEQYIGVEIRCERGAQRGAGRTQPTPKVLATAMPGLSLAAASGCPSSGERRLAARLRAETAGSQPLTRERCAALGRA
jgi:hypothetical protein